MATQYSLDEVAPGPAFLSVAWKMAKAGGNNWRIVPHLLAVAASFSCNYLALRVARLRSGRKQTLALALIEHMGDIVAAEPVSRLARSEYPDAAISWVSRKPYRDVVANFRSIDRVITVRCMTEWLLLWGARSSDLVWDLHISERPCPTCGIFFRKPGQPGRITYQTYYDHGSLLTVNCLSAGIPPIDDAPEIIPERAAIQRVDGLGLPERFVVIHCKSNEDSRDWQLDRWRALVAWIESQTGLAVCEIGSKPYVIQHDRPKTRDLCGVLALMETAEVIRRAALFIGVDSGPAHLANATGTPGVVLLGRYQGFQDYTPYSGGYADGTGAELIRSDGPARDITLQAVTAGVSKRLRTLQIGTSAYSPVDLAAVGVTRNA